MNQQIVMSDYFTSVAVKRLSSVEINPNISNQHEINGVAKLKKFLGTQRKKISARFLYLSDNEESVIADGTVTWYDARESHPKRTEYRLYYPANEVMEYAKENDLLVIAERPDETLLIMIVEYDSVYERQVLWLFGEKSSSKILQIQEFTSDSDKELDYVAKMILGQIGVEVKETDDNYLDQMLDRFKGSFPTTKEFSQFARETMQISMPYDPDEVILAWMNREEVLFRTLEKYLLEKQLEQGFQDVDTFIKVALSIINRRKSRAGLAFENHMEQILVDYKVSYSRGARTERKSTPDFLFPSVCVYHIDNFPTHLLTMLGVKTTCKDRWRQVLREAEKIQEKHLLTLEPGISYSQIREMKDSHLQLVVPSGIHKTYIEKARLWLSDLQEFLEHIKDKERKSRFIKIC